MNTTITALQLKHSTQGWAKLIGLGQSVDKTAKLDDSTMKTVGIDTLEYQVSSNALSTLEGLLRGATSPVEIDVVVSMVQKKGVASLQIESAEPL